MDRKLDLTRVDGPHSPELTVAAARLIADAIRFLNYATVKGGVECAGDVDDVLGGLAQAAGGLQQTLSQLQARLRADLDRPPLDRRLRRTAQLRMDDDTDPATAVEDACAELDDARAAAGALARHLSQARRKTARMYLTEEEER